MMTKQTLGNNKPKTTITTEIPIPSKIPILKSSSAHTLAHKKNSVNPSPIDGDAIYAFFIPLAYSVELYKESFVQSGCQAPPKAP